MLLVNRQVLLESTPDHIAEIEAEARKTVALCQYAKQLLRLREFPGWQDFDWGLMLTWANPVDEPFTKLMLSLCKHGYKYNAISMHRWWRRLKAVNQQHLISYFSYQGFQPADKKKLFWTDLYAQCCRTSEAFKSFSEIYTSDKAVEMNLRALLGISQARDIKEAWVQWAKANHPDKGGSVERFVLVKAAYEEWQNAV